MSAHESREMSPEELLDTARFLIEEADPGTAGLWPRASALLARQALEGGLDRLWSSKAPGVEAASARSQLLCLTLYLGDEDLAEQTAFAWSALSQACHHHSYELAPTVTDLMPHFEVVERLLVVASTGGVPA